MLARCYTSWKGANVSSVPVQEWSELDDWSGLWQRAVLKARGCDDCDNEKTPGKDPGKRPCGRVRAFSFSGLG